MAKAKEKTPKRSYKLDVMTLLEAVDTNKKNFYSNLTEEEKKGFSPWVAVRWMSTLSDNNPNRDYAILATNDLVNLYVKSLSNSHPELVYLLMTVAGTGKKQYHSWIPTNTKKASSTPKFDKILIEMNSLCNEDELSILKNSFSIEEATELSKRSGIDDKTLKEVREELKKLFSNKDD
jgi:hypothetical protein